jgi:fibronectin-binding autotransporter adhesin
MTNIASGDIAGSGGGVYSTSPGDINLTDCTILSNQSTHFGGGLQMSNGDLTLVNCDVSYNATGTNGGGLRWAGSTSVLQITGGSFIGNATTIAGGTGGGGGIAIGNGSVVALEQSSIHALLHVDHP